MSRLLAKGWVALCLFAALYTILRAMPAQGPPDPFAAASAARIALLFAAMGLLFIGGYGLATGSGPLARRLLPQHWLPGFDELVYLAFGLLSLMLQMRYLPQAGGLPLDALTGPLDFAVPGQAALKAVLHTCGPDAGRHAASDIAWLLAFIFFGSALSRIGLQAGILRLERKDHPEPLTPAGTAIVLGGFAISGLQLFYFGTLYPQLSCQAWNGLTGDLIAGQLPLMLAYLAAAALANLMATGKEA